ncbi:adenylate cyclase type 2-like [Ostrinia nubilalis]|uniref:adenylate cyclase type 2-like n=1 Tax=Ostrinia nubilalis TaxID=29057 RepID=UPI00308229AC
MADMDEENIEEEEGTELELEALYRRYCVRLKHALFVSALCVTLVCSLALLCAVCILHSQDLSQQVASIASLSVITLVLSLVLALALLPAAPEWEAFALTGSVLVTLCLGAGTLMATHHAPLPLFALVLAFALTGSVLVTLCLEAGKLMATHHAPLPLFALVLAFALTGSVLVTLCLGAGTLMATHHAPLPLFALVLMVHTMMPIARSISLAMSVVLTLAYLGLALGMRTEGEERQFYQQLISELALLCSATGIGLYYRALTERAHRNTFAGTRTCLEQRVKLECEREQQERLLLSVIPAYIAAEWSIAYYRALTERAHRNTFAGTRTCLEQRVKLECEREQQERLLLSVIPAYIAAEVR